jgi:hypothetical protein
MFIEGTLYDLSSAGFSGRHYSTYAVCRHCGGVLRQHVDLKCLFSSTVFEPVLARVEP